MRNRAFTLIELLVVVAIIALLASIAIPSLSEARRVSKKTVCLDNLHQIGVGLHAYLQSNRDTFPWACRMWTVELDQAKKENRKPLPSIAVALQNELGRRSRVFECPADHVMKPALFPTLGHKYFPIEESSYEWENNINGKRVGFKKVYGVLKLIDPKLKDMWLLFDFDPYHGGTHRLGTQNALFADFHVQSDKWKMATDAPETRDD